MDTLFKIASWYTNYGSSARNPTSGGYTSATYGAFSPTYYCYFRQPRNNKEAQMLYNHARTASWYMDAFPFLAQSGFPVKIGFDDIISIIPLYGDFVGAVMSFYVVYLAWLFGLPYFFLARMALNVIIDGIIGIVPFVGDFLDVLFKANLRNLAILEDWLLKDEGARRYNILIPPNDEFLPRRKSNRTGPSEPRESAKDKYRNQPRTTRIDPDDLDLD